MSLRTSANTPGLEGAELLLVGLFVLDVGGGLEKLLRPDVWGQCRV